MHAHGEPARTADGASVQKAANRLYDPDVYHLTSQQSSQLSSKLLDLVHSTPWHPLARKHLTTASVRPLQARGAVRGKPSAIVLQLKLLRRLELPAARCHCRGQTWASPYDWYWQALCMSSDCFHLLDLHLSPSYGEKLIAFAGRSVRVAAPQDPHWHGRTCSIGLGRALQRPPGLFCL